MEYRELTPSDLVLKGDVLNNAVLDGWRGGPVWMDWSYEDHQGDEFTFRVDGFLHGTRREAGELRALWYGESTLVGHDNRSPVFLRLNCSDQEVRSRLYWVLAAGEQCSYCKGSGTYYASHEDGSHGEEPCLGDGVDWECQKGWRRPPYDMTWLIQAEATGKITPLVAAAIWWCSVMRVEAGLGPVVGVLPPRADGTLQDPATSSVFSKGGALIRPTHILLPLPEGVPGSLPLK